MSRNTSKFLAVAILSTLAAVASVAVQAGEVYDPPSVGQFQSTRDRADVRAEAVAAAHQFRGGEAYDGVTAVGARSTLERAAVRAETVLAVRLGKTSRGEVGLL